MNKKMIAKICVDIGMMIILLFLMTYELIGQAAHEWLGIGIFILFFTHHILNRKWFKILLKGKYTLLRIWQTILVILVFFSMLSSILSGILISRSVLSFLPIRDGSFLGRNLHMLSAYWGLVLMSLHLGFHWSIMMGVARKLIKQIFPVHIWIFRTLVLMVTVYGIYAFIKRDIGSYMFMSVHFVFFDYEELLIFFLLDYIAVMVLFVCIGHYLTVFMRICSPQKRTNEKEKYFL